MTSRTALALKLFAVSTLALLAQGTLAAEGASAELSARNQLMLQLAFSDLESGKFYRVADSFLGHVNYAPICANSADVSEKFRFSFGTSSFVVAGTGDPRAVHLPHVFQYSAHSYMQDCASAIRNDLERFPRIRMTLFVNSGEMRADLPALESLFFDSRTRKRFEVLTDESRGCRIHRYIADQKTEYAIAVYSGSTPEKSAQYCFISMYVSAYGLSGFLKYCMEKSEEYGSLRSGHAGFLLRDLYTDGKRLRDVPSGASGTQLRQELLRVQADEPKQPPDAPPAPQGKPPEPSTPGIKI